MQLGRSGSRCANRQLSECKTADGRLGPGPILPRSGARIRELVQVRQAYSSARVGKIAHFAVRGGGCKCDRRRAGARPAAPRKSGAGPRAIDSEAPLDSASLCLRERIEDSASNRPTSLRSRECCWTRGRCKRLSSRAWADSGIPRRPGSEPGSGGGGRARAPRDASGLSYTSRVCNARERETIQRCRGRISR